LSDFPHFANGVLQAFVIVDRFRHLGGLLFGQRDTGSLAIDLEGPASRAGCLERNTSLTDRSNFGELLLQGGVAAQKAGFHDAG
jgi:hypothetical protein